MEQRRVHLTGNTTAVVVAKNAYLAQAVFCCSDAGTNWVVRLQSKGVPPMILALSAKQATADGAPIILKFDEEPLFMEGGIDIKGVSGTAGVVDAWINFIPDPYS
jgi:hypothetical protein